MEDERILKILFTKSGSGSTSTRITLPTTWVRELGSTIDDREVKVTFDGKKIIIEKL